MVEFFQGAGENVIQIILGAIALVFTFIGYKVGNLTSHSKFSKDKKSIEKDSHGLQKSLQRLWEEDKNKLEEKIKELKSENSHLANKVEDYRKKLSGMGVLNFSGSKKRADILYSLLLENEALEQLITTQSQSMINDKQTYLNDRLLDIRKRQRLMAELFNDDTIKNYVKEVLDDDTKLSQANDKIDQMADKEMLEQDSPEEESESNEEVVEESTVKATENQNI